MSDRNPRQLLPLAYSTNALEQVVLPGAVYYLAVLLQAKPLHDLRVNLQLRVPFLRSFLDDVHPVSPNDRPNARHVYRDLPCRFLSRHRHDLYLQRVQVPSVPHVRLHVPFRTLGCQVPGTIDAVGHNLGNDGTEQQRLVSFASGCLSCHLGVTVVSGYRLQHHTQHPILYEESKSYDGDSFSWLFRRHSCQLVRLLSSLCVVC